MPLYKNSWTPANDGAGSGLDADLLDGNQATAFYLATNPSGYTSNAGTVTSVSGTGTVNGITLSGTVTSSGNLTLSGAFTASPSDFGSQTANTFLAAPNGTAGVSSFRAIVAADIPTLNQNTTGSAATLTTARTLTIGSTGKTFNGSANVSWSLAEIGAQAAGSYLTSESDTLSTVTGRGASTTTAITLAGGSIGTTAGSQIKMLTLSASNSNGSYLEIAETRQNAGTTWSGSGGSGWRLQQKVDSTWMGYIQFNGNGNDGGISMGTGTTTTSATSISEKWRLDSSGRVGIGVTTISHSLQVKSGSASGTLSLSGGSESTGGASYIIMGNNDSGGASGPNVIMAANRAIAFGVGTSFTSSGGGTFTNYMRIESNGNTNIGYTSDAGYKLAVNGSFAATTKSFLIQHPTKPDMKLRYGSLEGPENGVYVRGRLSGNVIELPDYWVKLVDTESITVHITPIGKHQKLYVKDIRDNKVYIANDGLFNGDINCFYYVLAERIDVEKLEVEIF